MDYGSDTRRIREMPLTFAKAGQTVTVRRITGRDEVRQHLAALGRVAEPPVTIISEMAGNRIVQIRDSRIALEKSRALRVMI